MNILKFCPLSATKPIFLKVVSSNVRSPCCSTKEAAESKNVGVILNATLYLSDRCECAIQETGMQLYDYDKHGLTSAKRNDVCNASKRK